MEGIGEVDGRGEELSIIYFLSRNGQLEQPHLIRVHHQRQKTIQLQDLKRWLSQLEGKDMPNSFSWSYKKRYKETLNVWQDLTHDNDIITPFSSNEFVLKGSEISDIPTDSCTCGKKTKSDPKTSASTKDSSNTHVASRPDALNCLKTNNNCQGWTEELISAWADSCSCGKKTRSESQTSALAKALTKASSKTCVASRPNALKCLKTNNNYNYNQGRIEERQTRKHARGMKLKHAKQ